MEQIIKENALPEAATPEQSKQVKPLYEDLSISKRIMQVLIPTLEIIRILGDGERRFTYYVSPNSVNVYETRLIDRNTIKHEFVKDWVNVYYDTNIFNRDRVVYELDLAIDTMTDLLGSVRKELGYEE